jgi:hypothetical protein
MAGVLLCATAGVWAENAVVGTASPAGLSATEVVAQMQRHNDQRTEELKHYTSLRHYQVEYKGFSRTLVGKMDVEADYDAATGKSFRIVSESGSKFLCEKVLKRAVDGEREASQDTSSTALTTANYKFQLLGSENLDGRPTYILNVEPITANRFLYRGKIWVDATDFAVAKIEAQPSKNPSFMIAQTLIHFTTDMANGFWLPGENRSETKVRIGGTAVLTIDYGNYQFAPNTLHAGGS